MGLYVALAERIPQAGVVEESEAVSCPGSSYHSLSLGQVQGGL